MNTCTDHISIETTHGRSQLYPSAIRSIIDLQNLVPSALGCVNNLLTYASWYNIYYNGSMYTGMGLMSANRKLTFFFL